MATSEHMPLFRSVNLGNLPIAILCNFMHAGRIDWSTSTQDWLQRPMAAFNSFFILLVNLFSNSLPTIVCSRVELLAVAVNTFCLHMDNYLWTNIPPEIRQTPNKAGFAIPQLK